MGERSGKKLIDIQNREEYFVGANLSKASLLTPPLVPVSLTSTISVKGS
jgi:hypothetical protein